ncbi:MAG TPA: cytochrome c oxidase assembly protein [Hyphomicrobiaceae bacterium]|nr:cytochrome c oxidase assembly protein [Hyphomicrobiaceae bacterium]
MTSKADSSGMGRHRSVALWCAGLVLAMVGAAYAAVPLYRLLCQATGFDGTPRVASKPSDTVLDRTVTIRFDANVAPDLPWSFGPVETTTRVKIGENTLAFYRATNTSDRPVWGMATFNVYPEQAAPFFNKIQCFCFTEQLLKPGESVEMPVSFFVDPQMVDDKNARGISQITLSYTFYPTAPPKSGVAGGAGNPATPEAVQRKGQAG